MNFSKLTQRQTGVAFGITGKTVQRWTDIGCPRNSDKTYDLKNVIGWKINSEKEKYQSVDQDSKLHLANWRREKSLLAALERRRVEGDYILASDVDREAFRAGAMIREGLESIAERCAPLVAATSDQFECREILYKEISFILNHLADTLQVKGDKS